MLPCLCDYHVHAVYDATDSYPEPVCGLPIVPGFWLPRAVGPIVLCRRCLASVCDDAELCPAAEERQRYLATQPGYGAWPLLLESWRRHLVRRYDRRIRRALASEWPRHG